MPGLKGKRILAVEDEALVAMMLEDMLTELGVITIGPASTVAGALELAKAETLDAAILDVNLRGERVDPVAAVLVARAIPFIYVTGYEELSVETPLRAPVIDKPYTQNKLEKILSRLIGASDEMQITLRRGQ